MIQAMIFDLDGTLVKTERLKALSYARAARALRPELREDDVVEGFGKVVGLSRREVATYLVDRFDLEEAAAARMDEFSVDTPWQAYVQVRLSIYEEMLADPAVLRNNQWPHNMALLDRAHQECSAVGLATMSYCPQVQRVLGILDLQDHFDFVASRDDVEQGKPDPEIYLLVAAELDMPPENCLVIEDSPSGVKAALAANMHCIAVATPFTQAALHEADLLDERWIVDEPDTLLDVVDQMLEEQRHSD